MDWPTLGYLIALTALMLFLFVGIPWLTARQDGQRKKVAQALGPNERYAKDTDEGKLFATIAGSRCPDCGKKTDFYEGPSGGMSTNIFCAQCGHGFNITPVIGIAERIGARMPVHTQEIKGEIKLAPDEQALAERVARDDENRRKRDRSEDYIESENRRLREEANARYEHMEETRRRDRLEVQESTTQRFDEYEGIPYEDSALIESRNRERRASGYIAAQAGIAAGVLDAPPGGGGRPDRDPEDKDHYGSHD